MGHPWLTLLTVYFLDDTPVVSPAAEAIPEYTAEEESDDQKNWRKVTIGDQQFTIDMKVVEPYKRVLSHGGKTVPSCLQS